MPRKILVVDEKLFMVRLIQHHLEKAGFELIRARNQQEAIEAMETQSPELVVMDDSTDPNQTAYAGRAAHSIPLIRMTDVAEEFHESENHADVVLTKPFSPTQLMAEVKRLVPESKII